MDSNGYNNSLFDTEPGICYICKRCTDTVRHEIYGASNRSNSKKYGMWINVCPECHNMSNHAIHSNRRLDLRLKREGQQLFNRHYPEEEFIRIFGRNYL